MSTLLEQLQNELDEAVTYSQAFLKDWELFLLGGTDKPQFIGGINYLRENLRSTHERLDLALEKWIQELQQTSNIEE